MSVSSLLRALEFPQSPDETINPGCHGAGTEQVVNQSLEVHPKSKYCILWCLDILRVELKSIPHEFIRACWKGYLGLISQRSSSCFLLHENGLRQQLIRKGVHHDKTKDAAHNPGNGKRTHLCFGCAVQLFSVKCSAEPNQACHAHWLSWACPPALSTGSFDVWAPEGPLQPCWPWEE